MAREIVVAAALVVVAGALTTALAADSIQNVKKEDIKSPMNKEIYLKKIIEKQSPTHKSIRFDKDKDPSEKGLSSKTDYIGALDSPQKDSDNSIPGSKNDEKGIYEEIRKDLSPETAVKAASRMIEEEADRRKKFRNMMRSLVHSELPHLDPKLDYTADESEESFSKERNTDTKPEEDMLSTTLSRFSRIFPFLLSRFPPFSPLQPPMFSRSGPAIEVSDVKKSADLSQLPSFAANNNQDLSSRRKDPVMLFIPRRSLRIDMTFIPIRGDSLKENFKKSDPLLNKGESDNKDEKPHSIRVFSSDSASSFPNVGSFPFSRFLNFFRSVGEDTEAGSPQSKSESVTSVPENQSARRKREIPTTEGPTAATVASRSAPDERSPAAVRNVAPAVSASASQADDGKAEPRIFNIDDEKDEVHHRRKPSSRMLPSGMETYGMGVMDDPTRFHPHPMAAFAIPEGMKFPDIKPYFHMMPYYFTGAMLPDKIPIGIMGMMPGMMGSGLEQQMVAMNQLAQEASQGAAASVEAPHHQPLLGGVPCLSPCAGIPMRAIPSMARKKRSISETAPFQQAYDAPRHYDAILPQRRVPGEPASRQDFQIRTNMDDESFDAEPAVVQSKLLLEGEPEAIRKLNPHFKMSFGSEESEKKSDPQREQVVAPEGMKKVVDKSKASPFSLKKYYRTIPEKKKSKKMLAAMNMNPSQSDPLWEVPAFGVNPFLPRMAPSLLGEMETPVAEERVPFRGKRSVPHVQFVHPAFNSEEQQPLAAIEDDLLIGEGSSHDYLSGLRSNGRKGNRRSSKSKPTPNVVAAPTKSKAKIIEEQVLEILKYDKDKPDFMPWLDPTMKGDDHDDHFHRRELGNDFKLSSYDH